MVVELSFVRTNQRKPYFHVADTQSSLVDCESRDSKFTSGVWSTRDYFAYANTYEAHDQIRNSSNSSEGGRKARFVETRFF